MGPKTASMPIDQAKRRDMSRREKQNTLRGNARVYFGSGILGPYASLPFEPDQTTHATKLKMRKDPVIALGMWTTKGPIRTAEYTIKCNDPIVAKFVDEQVRPLWGSLIRSALNCLDFGWQPHEILYQIQDVRLMVIDNKNRPQADKPAEPKKVEMPAMVCLKEIKQINPSTVRPVYDSVEDEFIGIEQTQVNTPEPVFIPKNKLFISTFDEEWGNKQGRSLLDNAYRPWYYSFMVEQLWARYMERRTIPPIVGTGPVGSRVDSDGNEHSIEDIMLTIVNNIHHGNGGYLPFEGDPITRKNMWGIEPLQFFQQSDQFQTFMATQDARMLRGILMPEKAIIQGSKVGTLSETEQFTDTFLTGLDVLLFELQTFINEQIIKPLLALNFSQYEPCQLLISQITSQRRAALKDLVTLLMDATDTNRFGVEYTFKDMINFESIAKQLGVPIRDPDEIIEKKPDPALDPNANGNPRAKQNGAPAGRQSSDQSA